MGEPFNPAELWSAEVACDCTPITFLEFWDAHMLVVSPLVCFALVIVWMSAVAFAPRGRR